MAEKAQILISAVDDTKRAFASVKESMRGVGEAITSVKGLMAGLGVSLSGAAFVGLVRSSINAADELNKLSQKIGVSVESLSSLKYVAELSDLSLESFTTGLKKLSSALLAASSHSQAQERIFNVLGISINDASGQMRKADDVLLDVADRFAKMKDGVEKTALAVKLFGKSGIDLIPFLNQGADGIERLKEEARKLGIVISGETAAAAEAYNDNLKRLRTNLEAISNSIAAVVLPSLVNYTNQVVDAEKATGSLAGALNLLIRQKVEGSGNVVADITELQSKLRSIDEQIKAHSGNALKASYFSDDIAILKFQRGELEKQLGQIKKLKDAEFARIGENVGFGRGRRSGDANNPYSINNIGLNEILKEPKDKAPSGENQGEGFLRTLKEQIEQVGRGEFAMLRLKAALLGVSAAADPLIKRLQKTKEAHQDLIDRQDAAARSVDNLIEQMNRADFYDPQKIDDFTKGIKDNIDEVKFQTSIINDSALAQQLATEARKIDLEVQKVSKDLTRENTDELKKQAEVLKGELSDALKQANAESRTFNKGMSDAFKRYIDDAENVAKRTDDAFTKAFQGAEDALTQFVTTGKLGFGDFLKSIATDLARSNIKDLMANLFKTNMPSGGGSSGGSLLGSLGSIASSYFGGGGSGLDWMSSIDTMYGFASGGKFRVGGSGGTDSQLVAFRASPDETVHVTRPDQSMGANVGVNITINNDGGSIQKNEAGKLGRDMEAAILGVVIKHRRPGGALA